MDRWSTNDGSPELGAQPLVAGTEYPVTVAVNQNANEFLRMIGALAQGAILRFNTARIDLLEKIMKQVAIMPRSRRSKTLPGNS